MKKGMAFFIASVLTIQMLFGSFGSEAAKYKKGFSVSKQVSDDSTEITIKAKKGYRVYYSLNNKFSTKKKIEPNKKKRLLLKKSATLRLVSTKKKKVSKAWLNKQKGYTQFISVKAASKNETKNTITMGNSSSKTDVSTNGNSNSNTDTNVVSDGAWMKGKVSSIDKDGTVRIIEEATGCETLLRFAKDVKVYKNNTLIQLSLLKVGDDLNCRYNTVLEVSPAICTDVSVVYII